MFEPKITPELGDFGLESEVSLDRAQDADVGNEDFIFFRFGLDGDVGSNSELQVDEFTDGAIYNKPLDDR